MMKQALYGIAVFLFILLLYFGYNYYRFTQDRDELVHQKGMETTQVLRDEVDAILGKIEEEGKRLAELFGSNDYTTIEVEKMIKESALSIPEIQGVTAGYEPNAFSTKRRLYCPYYDKGTQKYIYIEDAYDYYVKCSTFFEYLFSWLPATQF